MTAINAAREMRANGATMSEIVAALGISKGHAYKSAGDVVRGVKEAASTIIRFFPHNGGCSTQSGMRPVTLPRIPTLHGAA